MYKSSGGLGYTGMDISRVKGPMACYFMDAYIGVSRRSLCSLLHVVGLTIPGNNSFLFHVVVQSGLQGVKAKIPFLQFLLDHG